MLLSSCKLCFYYYVASNPRSKSVKKIRQYNQEKSSYFIKTKEKETQVFCKMLSLKKSCEYNLE